MSRKRFLEWYHNYALAIGVSSYRLVAGRLHQSWLTWSYALVVNIIVLVSLPVFLWYSAIYFKDSNYVPNHMQFTPFLFYASMYASITITILSRGSRDSHSVDLHRIVFRLKLKSALKADRVLRKLFYWKFGTMILLCLFNIGCFCLMPGGTSWKQNLIDFIICNITNVPIVARYRYFTALWFISGSYQYIVWRINDILSSIKARKPFRSEIRELDRLWSLHATLRRYIKRVNKVYGLIMLVARFDFIIYNVIFIYWVILYLLDASTPFYKLFFCGFYYWLHSLDFFLLDTMCELTVQYQNEPHHEVSEGTWHKEVLIL